VFSAILKVGGVLYSRAPVWLFLCFLNVYFWFWTLPKFTFQLSFSVGSLEISDTEESNDVITRVILTSYIEILFVFMANKLQRVCGTVPVQWQIPYSLPYWMLHSFSFSLSNYGKIVSFLPILFNPTVQSTTFLAFWVPTSVFLLKVFPSVGKPIWFWINPSL
jgi:hypothetical protein